MLALLNLISRYCFLENKNIKFVAPTIQHPDKNVGVVKIIHEQFVKIISNAIKAIINDIKTIRKSF